MTTKRKQQGKSIRVITVLVLAAVWGLPASALASTEAAHGAHPVVGIGTLFWPAVNFAIYALLMRFAYKKVGRPLLRDRAIQVKQDINTAASHLREAESLWEDLKQRLELIQAEKTELGERLAKDGDNIAATLVADAERAAKRKREDTERRIRSEFARVQSEIRREVVLAATEAARGRLANELSTEDDKRLRQEAVRSLA